MIKRASDSSADFKRTVRDTVALYKLENKGEYELVKQAILMRRKLLKDPRYGQILDGSDGRALFEIPEQLHGMIISALTSEGIKWFKSKEGGRWFAETFPMFALASDI